MPLPAIAPAPDIRVSALSQHFPTPLPTDVFQHGVSFLCGKNVFNTLFDTGASNSIVDPAIIPLLHLQSQVIAPVDPAEIITLANGSTVPRVGSVRIRFKPVTVLPAHDDAHHQHQHHHQRFSYYPNVLIYLKLCLYNLNINSSWVEILFDDSGPLLSLQPC